MIVHLYAQCWNDEWILPFFFRHYDGLVDRYVIYDDGSTDGTLALLRAHPKVETRQFPRGVADSFVLSEQAVSNQCWKESRGEADWVIVTDLDEFLFHPSGRGYLERCAARDVTLIPALGFQMISDRRPQPDDNLCADYSIGAPYVQMMKPSIFHPLAVTEMNFAVGRHQADPTGRIRIPEIDEMLLFHYKYMGFEETRRRHRQLLQGLGTLDWHNGWGHKYSWTEEQLQADWKTFADAAIDTMPFRKVPRQHYPIAPWWEKFRG